MNDLNRRHALVRRGDCVLIALSGGPDSTALAHLLSLWRRKHALKLVAAHVHHGLSNQNDRALSLARTTAKELGIPFYSKKIKVRALSERKKISLEEAGRDARYIFFEALSRRLKIGRVATAHTRDDQAETVMMRIIRGCGLHGLAGIPAKRRLGKTQVIRPLLDCQKKDLLRFLAENGIRFQTDRSNASARFTRNRVRHELLPWISKNLNPSIHNTLANFAEHAASKRRPAGHGRPRSTAAVDTP